MDSLCLYFLKNEIINENEISVVKYGIKFLGFNLLTIIITLVIGAFFDKFFLSIYFLGSFIPARMSIGGYHCKKASHCFLSYCFLIFLLFYFDFQSIEIYHCYILITILVILPNYVSINKTYLKQRNYKKIKMIIVIIHLVLVTFEELIIPIFMSLLLNSFLLISGHASYYWKSQYKHVGKWTK